MGITFTTKVVLLSCLLLGVFYGCSVRYPDVDGHDTLKGFPPQLNDVETAPDSNDRITWRRLRRTGVGLCFSKQSLGLMIGYEDVFLLWVEGDGAWDISYSSEKGMSITELNVLPDNPKNQMGVSATDKADKNDTPVYNEKKNKTIESKE